MLGWIKYLRRVRVETDALKRNKDLASTRTPLFLVGTKGSQVQIPPLRPKISQALNVLEICSIIVSHHRDRNALAGVEDNMRGRLIQSWRMAHDASITAVELVVRAEAAA
jgi:hypothetical protein